MNCLQYALKFWSKNRDFFIYYNMNHVINLEKGLRRPKGYIHLHNYTYEGLVKSFGLGPTYQRLLKKYLKSLKNI